ncbi:hypothetical protein [Bacillus velezensis]|uniref:hypothetical protein n=1 Tax=Bacillus velezensis TaxID=492670 RepID=UPI00398BD90E
MKKAFAFGCILAAAAYAAGFVLPFGFAIIFGAVTAVLIVTVIIVSGLAVSGAEQRPIIILKQKKDGTPV